MDVTGFFSGAGWHAPLGEAGLAQAVQAMYQARLALAAMDIEARLAAMTQLAAGLGASDWAAGAEACGCSAATLAFGFGELERCWQPDAMRRFLATELPQEHPHWRPLLPQRLAMVLAATVPPAGIQATMLPVMAGVPVLVRAAARLQPLMRAFLEVLARCAPALAPAVILAHFPSSDLDSAAAMAAAGDAIVVHGSARAVAQWQRLARPHQIFVPYGHRISAAYLGADPEPTPAILSDLALDLCLWDQYGCLSPQALYLQGDAKDAAEVARQLAHHALPPLEARFPLGPLDAAARAHRRSYIQNALLDAHAFTAPGGATILAYPSAQPLTPSCGARVLPVYPVADLDDLIPHLSAAAPHLQCLGMAGATLTPQRLATLTLAGLNRVCPLGHMQRPPLSWRHDGIGTLAPLVRWVSLA